MDTKRLETFAQNARTQLHQEVTAALSRVLDHPHRYHAQTIADLQADIDAHGRDSLIEQVAYLWFNRFCALRYMDLHTYTPLGILTPPDGYTQPEILQEAKDGYLPPLVAEALTADQRQRLTDLLTGRVSAREEPEPENAAYRLLLVAACHGYHRLMPFMFAEIDDYTALLMPANLLTPDSVPVKLRAALTADPDTGRPPDVEVIGWLYQFYISERKDEVIGSKGKIAPADIPAATQLFTPHWIVRYLVENSLGRLWLHNFPRSGLAAEMDFYVPDDPAATEAPPVPDIDTPEQITVCDPAVGSGHMLVYAFDLLAKMYAERGYEPYRIPGLILEKNLVGVEIDGRAAALAAFALTMKARAHDRRFWRRGDEDPPQPQITVLEPVTVTAAEQKAADWMTHMPAAWRDDLAHDLELLAHAPYAGSLLRPRLTPARLDEALAVLQADEDREEQMGLLAGTPTQVRRRARRALALLRPLARRYQVVIANPPYLGGFDRDMKQFAKKQYPDSKRDMFAMFMERSLELATAHGLMGMINTLFLRK